MDSMNSDKFFNRKETDLSSRIFLNILELRKQGTTADLSRWREVFRRQLDAHRESCEYSVQQTNYVYKSMYALVAFIDETVLSIPCAERDNWALNPLQLELFGEYIAGNKFFTLLESILVNPSESSEVLNTYFLCLALGFKGKYANDKEGVRELLIERTGRRLRLLNQRQTVLISPDPVFKKSNHPKTGWPKHSLWMLYSIGLIVFFVITIIMKVLYNNASENFIYIVKSISP